MKETEELKTHKCSKCGEQVVLECFDYDDCDNYKKRDERKPLWLLGTIVASWLIIGGIIWLVYAYGVHCNSVLIYENDKT